MGAVKAGLVIEEMREGLVDEGLAGRVERARKYVGWPMLMVMKLRVG